MVKDTVPKFDFTNTMTSRTLHIMTSYHLSLACGTLYFDTLQGMLPRRRDYHCKFQLVKINCCFDWKGCNSKHLNLSMINLRVLIQEENLALPGQLGISIGWFCKLLFLQKSFSNDKFKYHVFFCDLLALQTSPGYTPAWKGGCYLKGNSRHCSFWWFYWMIIGNFGDCHEPQYQGTRPRQQSCRWDTWGSSSRGSLARCTTTIATLLCINVSFMISIIFLYHYYYSIILRLCIIIARTLQENHWDSPVDKQCSWCLRKKRKFSKFLRI